MQYTAFIASKQAKAVIKCDTEANDDAFIARIRPGETDGDAQHFLDQALLDYKIEGDKRVSSSDDCAAGNLARRKESTKEKVACLPKRKAKYES